jgi:hypothetical protein
MFGRLKADFIGARFSVHVHPAKREICIDGDVHSLTPDEARMIGVRLIEAATLADNESTIRRSPEN